MTAPESAATKLDEELDLSDWIARNGRKSAIIGGSILLVGMAAWLFISSSRRKEAFAAQELMRARSSAEAGNLPLAASDLTRLTERFRGTRAGDQAAVLLNQIRLIQGQRDIAVTALQEFVRAGHDADVQASAYSLLGAGLEDQGKTRDAAQAYREAARVAKLDFVQAQALLDAGRAFTAAGDSTNAKTAYADVLDRFGRLDQAAEARVRMAELGGTVPPPPPPVDSTD